MNGTNGSGSGGLRAALNGFRSIAAKETLHIRRDPTTLVFALLIPIVQLILFGYAIDFDVRHVRTAVVDLDNSRESREYVASLRNTEYLDVATYLPTPDAAAAALRRGDVRVAVLIPPDFSRRWGSATDPPVVRVLLDGSDSQTATPARAAFARPAAAGAGGVDVRVDVLFNPEMRTPIYTIPGLVGVLIQLVTVSLTAFSLVREREQGTLEQLMVSPVGRLGLILGKLVPYFFLGLAELLAVLYGGHLIFDVPIQGSVPLLVLLSVPFILASLALGLLISTVAQTQGQALQMTLLTVMPSILLSGYIAPRETQPGALYILGNIFPVTYFLQILRAVVVRGAGFTDFLPSFAGLCALTVLLLTLATARFRKSIS